MTPIEKKLIVDEDRNPVAVVIDYQVFQEIEKVLEDYALGHLLDEVEGEQSLTLGDARAEYELLTRS